MATALILTRWKSTNRRLEVEALQFAPNGVSITDVTPFTGSGTETIADGDPVVVHVDGLSNAQLTVLQGRAQVIALTSKQDADPDFDDAPLTRVQVAAVATRLRDEFGVPLAKIREWLEDRAINRKDVERMIRRLCQARKEGNR